MTEPMRDALPAGGAMTWSNCPRCHAPVSGAPGTLCAACRKEAAQRVGKGETT